MTIFADEVSRRVSGVGRGTLTTLIGRAFDVLATYAFYAIIARSLTVAQFGRLILGFTILQTAASVARLGLDQALLAIDANGAANRFGASVIVVTSTVISAVTVAAFQLAGHPLPLFGVLLAVSLPFVAVGQFIVGALRARNDVALAAVADGVVQPGLAAAGAWLVSRWSFANMPAENLVVVFAVSWIALLVFAVRVEWRGGTVDRSSFLRNGRAMLGVVVSHQSAGSADVLILGALASATEVGYYAVAQKIAAAFLLLHGAITTAVTPYMRALTDDRSLLAHYYQVVTRWMVVLAMPLLAVCVALPHFILRLFGDKYAEASAAPLILLSIAGVVMLASGPAGSVLLCTGNADKLFRVTAAGTIALVLSVAALAHFGSTGAAAGMLLGRILGRGMLVIAMRRYAKIGDA